METFKKELGTVLCVLFICITIGFVLTKVISCNKVLENNNTEIRKALIEKIGFDPKSI